MLWLLEGLVGEGQPLLSVLLVTVLVLVLSGLALHASLIPIFRISQLLRFVNDCLFENGQSILEHQVVDEAWYPPLRRKPYGSLILPPSVIRRRRKDQREDDLVRKNTNTLVGKVAHIGGLMRKSTEDGDSILTQQVPPRRSLRHTSRAMSPPSSSAGTTTGWLPRSLSPSPRRTRSMSSPEMDNNAQQDRNQQEEGIPTHEVKRSGGNVAVVSLDGGAEFEISVEHLREDVIPLLVLVNGRSGGGQGKTLISDLRVLLNPLQIVDVGQGPGLVPVLKEFSKLPRLRILACGGDGTVAWVLDSLALASRDLRQRNPPVAILPLGTGNDLSRILGWGGGYSRSGLDQLQDFLTEVCHGHMALLDRWDVLIGPPPANGVGTNGASTFMTNRKGFQNYFGVGIDAQAALHFHHLREARPRLFFSRVINKMWYAILGTQELFRRNVIDIRSQMTLVADGNKIELPENCQGVIFMNIASYGGGASLLPRGRNELQTFFDKLMEDDWESDDDTSWREAPEGGGCEVHMAESSMQDGLLDVVALRGIVHLGQLQVGMGQAVQLCQCKQAVVVTSQKLPMHVDGEPWGQKPCEVVISAQKEKACMLRRTVSSGGELAQEFLRLLDWGEARGIMTDAGKHVLLEELSRRVESSHPGLGGKVPSSHNMAALSGSKRRRKT